MAEQKETVFTHSVSRRITKRLILLMLAMAAVVIALSYWALESTYTRLYNEKAQDLVRTLAAEVDGDRLAAYVETGEKDEYYVELKKSFNESKEHFRGIQYLYMYQPLEDHFVYIVEGARTDDDPAYISDLGDVFEYGEVAYQYFLPDLAEKKPSTELISGPDQGYGKCLYTWAPVLDTAGNVAGVVEADCALSELRSTVNSFVMPIFASLLAFIAIVVIVMILVLRRTVTDPLGQLTSFVNSYEHGTIDENLDQFLHDDEIKYMASSFQEMTFRIDRYIHDLTSVTAEKERIGAELDMAARIQANMLPNTFPAFPKRKEFELYATMEPAKEVGGDFYDFFLVDDDHLAMVMADVSGKGVPAALFMMTARTLIKDAALEGLDPSSVMFRVNERLDENNEDGLFVTVWLGILEISTGELTYSDAGHEKLLLYQQGTWRFMPKGGCTALAVLEPDEFEDLPESYRYRNETIRLQSGDMVFQYTDGVTEATDARDELFGDDRLLSAMKEAGDKTPENLLPHVRGRIDEFVKDAPQFDDITMLGLRYLGVSE